MCGCAEECVAGGEHVMSMFANVGLPPLDDAVIHSRIKLFIASSFFSIGSQHGIGFGLDDY